MQSFKSKSFTRIIQILRTGSMYAIIDMKYALLMYCCVNRHKYQLPIAYKELFQNQSK